jgi:predicted TPR repeat methyltransferase
MRTAADFDHFYAAPDPWRIQNAAFRDKVLRVRLAKFIRGKTVLELGCGEGHITAAIFGDARGVTGIDISDVAIGRAKARHLPNARFETADFLRTSFAGYDVITAIECLYYLSPEEQEEFFVKAAREHPGKPLLLSGPIIGENEHRRYFTHSGLLDTFRRHRYAVIEHRNLYIRRTGALSTVAAALVRLPLGLLLMDFLPESFIYQRLYAVMKTSRAGWEDAPQGSTEPGHAGGQAPHQIDDERLLGG